MIIPSIDLMGGHAVQLIGGKEKAIDAGDPIPIAQKFRLAGEIAVVDLDAALRQGDNAEVIKKLVRVAPCRVGGGIRDAQSALDWLDAGVTKVVLGTAATPEILKQLPKDRVVAALDAVDGEVVVDGWRTKTGTGIIDRMKELREYAGGFLVTFVEREGRMKGTAMKRVAALKEACGDAQLTVAGGFTTPEEIAEADALGADAQVGMALYSGRMDLGDAIAAPLSSDRPDGLWPTVVVDAHGVALGLAYSNLESLREAVKRQRGVYHSRSRGLWIKGETSGATQKLLRVDLDCDRDALRFTVAQGGSGFCHLDTRTCWGDDAGITHLARRLAGRLSNAPQGSYTARLFRDADLLKAKLLEEAGELADAQSKDAIVWEAADLIYFTLAKMVSKGVGLDEVERELDRRSLKISRRPGNAKETRGKSK